MSGQRWTVTYRDACEVCEGRRGGVPGNEHWLHSVLVCDYCDATITRFRDIALRRRPRTPTDSQPEPTEAPND